MNDIGHTHENRQLQSKTKEVSLDDFVLEKGIFSNIFEKDIRRIFIYKKAERLAKAIYLITPAFSNSMSLKNRIDAIAMNLIDAATLPFGTVCTVFSRELLALSSMLSIARTSGLLSPMNADIIVREAHILLQEVGSYEEPRLSLDSMPTLSSIAKSALSCGARKNPDMERAAHSRTGGEDRGRESKGHIRDTGQIKDRRETIMSVIKNKRKASIKDISTLIRDVSEKTIQRELSSLVESGMILKEGERRWSVYSLV